MTILKRLCSLLLTAVMVVSMLPVQALATEAAEEASAVTEAASVETQVSETETLETEPTETQTPEDDAAMEETSGTAPTEWTECQHISITWSVDDVEHFGVCDECGMEFSGPHIWNESETGCTVCVYVKPVITGEAWQITYVLNGGVNADGNPISYGEGTSCVLADPTREGFTFEGWFTDADFTNRITEISPEQTGEITLYAKWSSNAHQLAAPTDLEWGVMRVSKYSIPAGTALPGCISWKAGDSLQSSVRIAVYREGQTEPCFEENWYLPAEQGQWCSVQSFSASNPESGTYYFTVTAIGEDADTLDSETVSSGTWVYTKSTEKLPTVTGLSLTGGMVSWMPVETVDTVRGFEMEVYFRPNENDKPYVIMTRTTYGSWISGVSIADDQQREGTGYYSVRVRVLSADITQIGNGDWSEMSPEVYYESGTVSFPNFDSFETLQEYTKREYTQMTELKYVGTEPLVISGDLTIPSAYCHVVAENVEIAEGCTVTNYGGLQSPTITVNGSIVNEGMLYVINPSGSGLIVSPSGSYSGNGCITVANTGVSDPWERIQGLNQDDFETSCRQDDYWEIFYNPAPTYAITYVLNGGTNSPENPDSYVEGVGCVLADPIRDGYTFAGWYTEENFINRTGAIPSNQTGGVTLYARWSSIHTLNADSVRITEKGHSGWCTHCDQYIDGEHNWDYGASVGKYCTVCGYRDHEHTVTGYQMDEYEHAPICENCGPYNYEAHTGMGDGVCDVCGYHIHRCDSWVTDGGYHQGVCEVCGNNMNGIHTWAEDGSACTTCGYSDTHRMLWNIDETGHSGHCRGCSYVTDWAEHAMEDRNGVSTCTVCGYMEHEHHYGNMEKDYDHHSGKCDECGFSIYGSHEYAQGSDTCVVCGYMAHPHTVTGGWEPVYDWSEELQGDYSEMHQGMCGVCGGYAKEPHIFDKNFVCSVCGYHDHAKSDPVITEWSASETEHVGRCTLCNRNYSGAHQWNAEGTVCSVCGYEQHEHVWGPDCFEITENTHTRSCQYVRSGVTCIEICVDLHSFDMVDGVKTCIVCGYMEHDHVFPAWNGYEWGHERECLNCGLQENATHLWEVNADGVYVCSECGYKDHQHSIPKWKADPDFGHFGTCTDCGATIYQEHALNSKGICTVCGYSEKPATISSISYVLNGGENNPGNPETYTEGVGCVLLDPTKDGYAFEGWFTDKACTKQITEITPEQTGKVTLYAKWTKLAGVTYTWSGDVPPDGGNYCNTTNLAMMTGVTLPVDTKQYKVGEEVAINSDYSAPDGYIYGLSDIDHDFMYFFSGWFIDTNGNGQVDGKDEAVGETAVMPEDGLKLIGSWVASYGVTYAWEDSAPAGITGNGEDYPLPRDGNAAEGTTIYHHAGTAVWTVPYAGQTTYAEKDALYTFAGWYIDTNGNGKLDDGELLKDRFTMPAANVTILGAWTTDSLYSVTYAWSGDVPPAEVGTLPVDSVGYLSGENVTVDSEYAQKYSNGEWHPFVQWMDGDESDCYVFYGWYVDTNGDGQLDQGDRRANPRETMPEGGMTLVGLWRRALTAKYSWDEATPAGVAGDPENYPLPVDGHMLYNIPSTAWSENAFPMEAYVGQTDYTDETGSYVFAGWFDGEGTLVLPDTMLDKDMILYGRWTREEKYAVTYTWSGKVPPEGTGYRPGDSCPTIPEDSTLYSVGETVELKVPFPGYEDGYLLSRWNGEDPQDAMVWNFAGWFIDVNGNGEVDGEDAYAGNTAVMPENGLHLVGKWSRFHRLSAQWDEETTPDGVKNNPADYPLPYHESYYTIWLEGYDVSLHYAGLTDYIDADGTVYYFDGFYWNGEKADTLLMPEENVVLSLRWKKAEQQHYAITYVLNGGMNGGNPSYYTAGQTCVLEPPLRSGAVFTGWYVNDPDLSGEPITEIPADMTGDITLYAKWEVTSCSVVYELNESEAAPVYNDPSNPAVLTVDSKSVKLKKPTRAGYKFDGWFVNGEPVTEVAFDGRGELVIEAWWTPIDYKITYKNLLKDEWNPNPSTFTVEGLELEAVEREGFTFGGWFADAKFTKPIAEISGGTTKNTTVYAKWDVHTYTVHFDRNAPDGVEITGKDMKDLTVACGKTVKLTSCAFKDPGKEYVFAGWNTVPDGTGEGFVDKEAIENLLLEDGGEITLYAQWAENDESYTIFFTANCYDYEGEDPDPMTGNYLKASKLPKNPYTRPGYTFTGWNTAPNGSGAGYKSGASAKGICADSTGEVTLFAQWKPILYKISYTLNGGGKVSTNPTTYTVESLADGPIMLDAPEKKGYTFLGWSSTSKGEPDVECIEDKPTGKTTTLKLYAQWRPNEYTIWLAGNGSNKDIYQEGVAYGKTVKLSEVEPRSGYVFLGWNTMRDGSGKSYKNKASVKNLTLEDGDTVVLYAQWASERYTIEYASNGGTGEMDPTTGVKYGKGQKLSANAFQPRDGYIFLGWNTMPDGSGVSYKDKASVKNVAQGDAQTATLYAQWVKDEYTIAFDANGGDDKNGGRICFQTGVPYKTAQKLNENVFSREGYTFLGWNTKADGTGKTYKNKASVKSLCATGDGIVTLYAQWKLVAYKISYALGGGKNPAGAPKTFYVTSGTIPLPTPTKKGWICDGWVDGETGEIITWIDAAKAPRNYKLTAHWVANP